MAIIQFEKKSETCHVAFVERERISTYGKKFTGLSACRAVKEGNGWRIDRCDAVFGTWCPWEPISDAPFPTLDAAQAAIVSGLNFPEVTSSFLGSYNNHGKEARNRHSLPLRGRCHPLLFR